MVGPRGGATAHPHLGLTSKPVESRIAQVEQGIKEQRRDGWDGEQWDDNSGLVFYDYEQFSSAGDGQVLAPGTYRDFSITVPAQVVTAQQKAGTRFEIHAATRVNTAAAGSHAMNALLYIIVNGTTMPEFGQLLLSAHSRQGGTIDHFAVSDVAGGLVTVTTRVTNNAASDDLSIYFTQLKVRRARPVGL